MEITKKSGYAIRALVELAQYPGEQISSKVIAARQEIPANFLPQIIALLAANGWVVGVRGPGGGVRLKADPRSVTVLDVIELMEGKIAITHCLSEASCSRSGRCPVEPVWRDAQEAFLKVLNSTTIADLAENTP